MYSVLGIPQPYRLEDLVVPVRGYSWRCKFKLFFFFLDDGSNDSSRGIGVCGCTWYLNEDLMVSTWVYHGVVSFFSFFSPSSVLTFFFFFWMMVLTIVPGALEFVGAPGT